MRIKGTILKAVSLFVMMLGLFLNSTQAEVIKGGKTDKGEGGYYPYDDADAVWGLEFNATSSFVLKSVKVYNDGSLYTGERTIKVVDASGNNIAEKVVTVADGEQRLSLEMQIPVGTGYRLLADNKKGFWRDTKGPVYPYDIGGVVSITADTKHEGTTNLENYHFFYDWEIATGDDIPLSSSFSYSYVGRDVTFTNTSVAATSYSWDFGDGSTSTEANPTHTYTSNSSFTVKMTATNSSTSATSSATFSVTDELTGGGGELPERGNKALLELATATGCGLCPPVIHKYNSLWAADKEHLCYIEFHAGQGTGNPDPMEQWSKSHGSELVLWGNWDGSSPLGFYVYDTHPNSSLNGENRGGSSAPFTMMWPDGGDYPSDAQLSAAKAKAGDFTIKADAAVDDNGVLQVKAEIISKVTVDNVKVKVVVIEDKIHYDYAPTPGDDNGERDFNGVARVFLPGLKSNDIGIDIGSQTAGKVNVIDETWKWATDLSANPKELVEANCRIAIYVQKVSGTSEVLACTDFPISEDLTGGAGSPDKGSGNSDVVTEIVNNINSTEINAYPNPFNNTLNVVVNGNEQTSVSVYNLFGSVIYQNTVSNNTVDINTTEWKSGVYIVKLQNEAGTTIKKVIKK
jgi:PKD repeat protein